MESLESKSKQCFFKNKFSTSTPEFSQKKITKTCQILKDFVFKEPDLNAEFQQVDSNIEQFIFFLLSYLVWGQIWLNRFVNDGHFGHITNSLKETLGTTCQGCVQHSQKATLESMLKSSPGNGQKALLNRYYCSHVISVPMILVGQHALISIRKLAHSPIKTY